MAAICRSLNVLPWMNKYILNFYVELIRFQSTQVNIDLANLC